MILFKPYSSIKDFLQRFTIIKIGNLHIRLHKIVDKDRTTLLHNHPFNYISIILKGGYSETYIKNGVENKSKHKFLSIIKRSHETYHRIDNVDNFAITLFIAYGKYDWKALNTNTSKANDGIYKRFIDNKELWCKMENGIWFIGNLDKGKAECETRHSIHQCIEYRSE